MSTTLVAVPHTPESAVLESIRCLMTHPSVPAICGPIIRVSVTKRNRVKAYTIFVDYAVGWYGTRVRLHVHRSCRWGTERWSTVYVPTVDLWRFEDCANWTDVHRPLLYHSLPFPRSVCDPSATVSVSDWISTMPPLRVG